LEKLRIAILGIGGVGGYFGGELAGHFSGSSEVEIIFIARGENAKAIQAGGLKIVTAEGEQIVKPHLVTDNASEIGPVDLFILCTKAYDLEASLNKYRECIVAQTVILPLLNGVDHAGSVKRILPETEVWNGCVFIVSRLQEPGVVKIDSQIRLLQFGSSDGNRETLQQAEKLFQSAGIDAELVADIDKTVWEKFIFISSLATLTSFLDQNIGGILNSDENLKLLADLIGEVSRLARAKGIRVADDIEEFTLERIRRAPPASTSSMHSDFQKNGRTELETLTGYVVREARALSVETPVYRRLYEALRTRN
jgi:2-dehydropantoate 2-reductase